MANIKFRFGENHHVAVNLPSKQQGDGSILIGKATLITGSVKASVPVEFHESHIREFLSQLEEAYGTLQGEFTLKSIWTPFILHGTMTRKGMARVFIQMTSGFSQHVDHVGWKTEAYIMCLPEHLGQVIESLHEKRDI